MHAIYEFIDEPAFDHNFNHVDRDVTELTTGPAPPGLVHRQRPGAKAEPRDTVLSPDLFSNARSTTPGAIRMRSRTDCRSYRVTAAGPPERACLTDVVTGCALLDPVVSWSRSGWSLGH